MTIRRKDLSDITGRKCMSPGCKAPAAHVVTAISRRGYAMQIIKCAACFERRGNGRFASKPKVQK